MIPLSIPQDGDVVIRIVHVGARASYVLCVVPGEAQLADRDRQTAAARALAYAKRTGVNAWYADAEDRFEMLGAFRVLRVPGRREFLPGAVK